MRNWYILGLLLLTNLAAAQPTLFVDYLSIPILKGAEANPAARLMVHHAASAPLNILSLMVELNPEMVPVVEKIEVYVTGAEPFHARQLCGSIQNLQSLNTIPINLLLPPGQHILWLSPVLKPSARVGEMLHLSIKSIQGQTGQSWKVPQTVHQGHLVGVQLKKNGENGIHTYRIPGLVTTDQGTLLGVYDLRYITSRDLPGHIDVGLSRSTDGGNTWEPTRVIMDMGPPHENNGIGDPAILFDPATKTVWVAALWSKGNRSIAGSQPGLHEDTTGQLVLVKSTDDGRTWSAPFSITPTVKNPVWHLFFNGPGRGIVMHDGTLVFAAQYWDEKKMPHSTLIYSRDHGVSWQGKILGPKANTTESQVVETIPGTLMLNMRDNRGSYRSIAITSDLGQTWTEHHTSYQALPDPVCMGSLFKCKVNALNKTQEVLFFSNPHTSSGRYNLAIQASTDLGESWLSKPYLLDERLTYGYSCLTDMDARHIGILYEGQGDLYFVKVPVTRLLNR